ALKSRRLERRLSPEDRVARKATMPRHIAEERECVISEQSGAQFPTRDPRALVDRPGEFEWPYQMRREPEQGATLGARLEDQVDVGMLEGSHAAMNQPGRPARRAPRKIGFVHQRHDESARRGLVGNSAPRNAAADHEEIEMMPAERFSHVPPRAAAAWT